MATHVVALGHETLERSLVPAGGVCGLHVCPSTVEMIAPPATAVHSSAVKHAIDSAVKDGTRSDQESPPLVDLKIP
jgi:hypothetical protein